MDQRTRPVNLLDSSRGPAVAIAALLATVVCLIGLGGPGAVAASAMTIVSLGDSYSSGEGAAPYDADSDNKDGIKRSHKCHRSANAWPRLIGVAKQDHLACSGAVFGDLVRGQVNKAPDNVGQIARLNAIGQSTHVDRVVMTMGGNDIHFADRIRDCWLGACLNNVAAIKRDLAKLRPRFAQRYRDIMDAGDGAVDGRQGTPLLVVGYPAILPSARSKVRPGCFAGKGARRRAAEVVGALDATLAGAAQDAGADFVSTADVLKGHELCTGVSWVRSIVGKPGDLTSDQQQGHPLYEGQLAIALRVQQWLAQHRAPCTPSSNVAAIFDDSGSMQDNDPGNIRRSALQLLLSKPSAQNRTLGAIEFANNAGALFSPGQVAANKDAMLASLGALNNDGYGPDDAGGTDYNAAFAETQAEQPQATARIFLTDGGHNEGDYLNGHVGGPPTYVIGVNIGPAVDDGDPDFDTPAERLQRIASDTGGAYFPLKFQDDDSTATQVSRLQGAVNDIDARLTCGGAETTTTTTLTAAGAPSPPIGSIMRGQKAAEIVISWGTPDADVDLSNLLIRGADGRVIADLRGTHRIRPHHKKKRTKLTPGIVEGSTFDIVTVGLPKGTSTMQVNVAAPTLPSPTDVTVQVRPVDSAGAPGQTQVPIAAPQPDPTPSVTPTPSSTPTPAPTPPVQVRAYDNYNPATAGIAMCRGNPGDGSSMPGGTATQTFTVPGGVAKLDSARVQIDPDSRVTAHLQLLVNGAVRAGADAAAAGDTNFSWPAVAVTPGDSAAIRISFTASFGRIITVYTASPVGGTFTAQNSCPAGAANVTTGNGLRAFVSGWSG